MESGPLRTLRVACVGRFHPAWPALAAPTRQKGCGFTLRVACAGRSHPPHQNGCGFTLRVACAGRSHPRPKMAAASLFAWPALAAPTHPPKWLRLHSSRGRRSQLPPAPQKVLVFENTYRGAGPSKHYISCRVLARSGPREVGFSRGRFLAWPACPVPPGLAKSGPRQA